jgi:adenylyltransferase/sulfurtransferase
MASIPEISFVRLEEADRYSRQRLIAGWDQERLAKARILVVGAGALGNEVLKNLALLGIGQLLIVDFDRVEVSNLSRSVLFQEEDIGHPKASTAARAVARLNPEISVQSMDGDLESDLGLGEIRDCDLVLGCVDSIYARWALNRACQKAGRPWINAGINASVGEVSLYIPGKGACYECGMTQQMWRQIHERRSCMLLARKLPAKNIPATTIIASLTAALQVNEALAWLHGKTQLSSGEMVMVSLSPYSLSSFSMRAREDCLAHDQYYSSIFFDAGPRELTVAELLNRLPGAISLQLDFDVLEGWYCRNCGEQFTTARLSQTSSAQAECPECKAQRSPQLTHEISHGDRLANSSLHALGIPARSILRVKTESGQYCVEIAGTQLSRSSR